MEYSIKDDLKNKLYEMVSHTSIAPFVKKEDIVAYHNNYVYFISDDGVFGFIKIKKNELFDELIILKEYKKEYFRCTNFSSQDNDNKFWKFENEETVEILYKHYDETDEKISVLYYVRDKDVLLFDYYDEDDFNIMFVPDYTNDNLELIDEL